MGKAWRIRLATAAAAIVVLGLVPAAAQAGVGASAVPSFPTAVTVGNTGVPASIEVRNADNDANAADTNTVCNFGDGFPCPAGDPGITLIPSCAVLGPFSACATPDPGVFRLSDVATGAAGTGSKPSCCGTAIVTGARLRGRRRTCVTCANWCCRIRR